MLLVHIYQKKAIRPKFFKHISFQAAYPTTVRFKTTIFVPKEITFRENTEISLHKSGKS